MLDAVGEEGDQHEQPEEDATDVGGGGVAHDPVVAVLQPVGVLRCMLICFASKFGGMIFRGVVTVPSVQYVVQYVCWFVGGVWCFFRVVGCAAAGIAIRRKCRERGGARGWGEAVWPERFGEDLFV